MCLCICNYMMYLNYIRLTFIVLYMRELQSIEIQEQGTNDKVVNKSFKSGG